MVGDAEAIEISALTWSDDIEAHLARHDVAYQNLVAVLDSHPLIYRNLPDRGGTHVLIGPDDQGRILYVSVRPANMATVWEPVTAWESRFARRLWSRERGE